jgi:hypothetical protein
MMMEGEEIEMEPGTLEEQPEDAEGGEGGEG